MNFMYFLFFSRPERLPLIRDQGRVECKWCPESSVARPPPAGRGWWRLRLLSPVTASPGAARSHPWLHTAPQHASRKAGQRASAWMLYVVNNRMAEMWRVLVLCNKHVQQGALLACWASFQGLQWRQTSKEEPSIFNPESLSEGFWIYTEQDWMRPPKQAVLPRWRSFWTAWTLACVPHCWGSLSSTVRCQSLLWPLNPWERDSGSGTPFWVLQKPTTLNMLCGYYEEDRRDWGRASWSLPPHL